MLSSEEVVVTGTGFFGEARQQVRALVEALGATYSGELVDGLSTHLVCAHGANCNGVLKVKKAREWGIPVVRIEWLTDSEDVGCLLEASPYLILGSNSAVAKDCRSTLQATRQHKAMLACLSGPPEVLRSAAAAGSEVGSSYVPGTATSANAPLPKHVTQRARARPSARVVPVKPPSPPSSGISFTLSPEPSDLGPDSTSHISNIDVALSSLALKEQDTNTQGTGGHTYDTCGNLSVWVGDQEAESPGARVRVRRKLTKAPRKSSARTFQGSDKLKFFREVEVTTCEGVVLSFDTKDAAHCALLSYENKGGEEELAYCDLMHAYSTPGGEVWIEHGYLYDASDILAHPTGAVFLQQASIADGELVNTRNVYHSPASVIAGDFWLYASNVSMQRAKNSCPDRLVFFSDKYWDRKTGGMSKIPRLGKSKSVVV